MVQRLGEEQRLERLNALLGSVGRAAPFQRARLRAVRLPLTGLRELGQIPFTTKDELCADQARHSPFGSNLTYAPECYTHLHHTSGSTGRTLSILDTDDDWRWWRTALGRVLRHAGVTEADRVALAYSFGPYIQFWASYEGVQDVGALALALGGMNSVQRLRTIAEYEATVLLCTPSYALHLAAVAAETEQTATLDSVRRVLCTGEPGASVPAVRERIESLWGAACLDHAGASEAGPFAYPCPADGGLHLAEDEFVCEVIDSETGEAVADGELGELVVTALGRRGFPVIRYRTGDMIRCAPERCSAGHAGRWLPGGIHGRADDMVVVRGMNVFPSTIEQTLRESSGVGEFRITFYTDPRAMDEVKVEVELHDPSEVRAIQARMRHLLGLRVRIVPLKEGILPRSRGKARRVQDLRSAPAKIQPAER
jgi:phenylacetate-CoA ligase